MSTAPGPSATATSIELTTHDRVRMQQRGISEEILCTLLEEGRHRHDHRGCVVVHFDKRSRAALRQLVPGKAFSVVERWLSAYAVVDAKGAVITTGWRTRRIFCD